MRSILHKPLTWAAAALLLAAGFKLWLVGSGAAPFNSDEAVVALMARHILQGARPVFFYGQAYMGSLDAWLVAGAFALFGQQVWAIRLVQGLLYLGVLVTTGLIGRRAFGSTAVGALAMLLLAIPTVNVTLYTTVSLGGYGEALLIGNLALLAALWLGDQLYRAAGGWPFRLFLGWAMLGFLGGLGLWAFGLALVYWGPALIYALAMAWQTGPAGAIRQREPGSDPSQPGWPVRDWALAVLALVGGAVLGAAPWVSAAFQDGLVLLLNELGGAGIANVEQIPWIFEVGRHLAGFLLLGVTVSLGMRPPWDVTWLALPLLPFVLIFWGAVMGFMARSLRAGNPHRGEQALLVGVMAALLAGFVFSPFGADPSGRYFIPFAPLLALFAAALILHLRSRMGNWAFALAALLLVFHLAGTLQMAWRFPPGITTQFYQPTQIDHRYDAALMDFLRQNGEHYGYSNYWVAYPLAFLSGETLIFTPRLPYHLDFRHTERDNRYAPYNERAAQAGRVAYITTNHPELDQRLRDKLAELGVSFKERQIGDYQVFYALSQPVPPEALGFGITRGQVDP